MTSNKSKELLLEMKNIHIDGFSDERWHKILKGVDLTLHRGEILGLIGESGAGKSTMGKAAMGYTQPGCKIIKGEINFNGIDLAKLTEFEKRKIWGTKISYVAQSAAASFNPAHRLMDQTISAANRLKINPTDVLKKDAVQLYESLQLPDAENIGDRYPHQVSGGQLQRIMTAMAMSPRPELIIFDEPTTALDVTTQVEVLSAMRSIVDKFNTAAIYITHDLAVVAQMADRIKVLRYGEEVEEAKTRDMLSNPKEEYTKSLWSVRSLIKPEETNEDYILSIKNIDAAYGSSKVLHNVSIDIPKGKTVAIVGESGSGKSTTARVITGLLPQTKGEIIRRSGTPFNLATDPDLALSDAQNRLRTGGGLLGNKANFSFISWLISFLVLQKIKSGDNPISLSFMTECWVGFVFSSPLASINGNKVK